MSFSALAVRVISIVRRRRVDFRGASLFLATIDLRLRRKSKARLLSHSRDDNKSFFSFFPLLPSSPAVEIAPHAKVGRPKTPFLVLPRAFRGFLKWRRESLFVLSAPLFPPLPRYIEIFFTDSLPGQTSGRGPLPSTLLTEFGPGRQGGLLIFRCLTWRVSTLLGAANRLTGGKEGKPAEGARGPFIFLAEERS